jgi:hypothetical protein
MKIKKLQVPIGLALCAYAAMLYAYPGCFWYTSVHCSDAHSNQYTDSGGCFWNCDYADGYASTCGGGFQNGMTGCSSGVFTDNTRIESFACNGPCGARAGTIAMPSTVSSPQGDSCGDPPSN